MSHLEIYDPPVKSVEPTSPSHLTKLKNDINKKINDTTQYCNDTESQVLTAVRPVTKYIPVSYDTVKRLGVVGLCTLSGVLQGRRRGLIRKYTYPVIGTVVGCAACYPKCTYATTNMVLTTTLPIVAVAGKSTAEFVSSAVDQSKIVSAFVYDKYKETFPKPPTDINTQDIVPATETPVEKEQEILECSSEETVAVIEEISSVVQETSVIEESSPILTEDLSTVVEDTSSINEHVEPASQEAVLEPVLIEAIATETEESVIAEVDSAEQPVSEAIVSDDSPSDQVITVEKLVFPVEVPPIEGDLGMGDEEHDDMYSTRSARN